MSRESGDELAADGTILNGFDYALQVWVQDGICLSIGAGREMYAGRLVKDCPGHEVRDYNAEDYARAIHADMLARSDA